VRVVLVCSTMSPAHTVTFTDRVKIQIQSSICTQVYGYTLVFVCCVYFYINLGVVCVLCVCVQIPCLFHNIYTVIPFVLFA